MHNTRAVLWIEPSYTSGMQFLSKRHAVWLNMQDQGRIEVNSADSRFGLTLIYIYILKKKPFKDLKMMTSLLASEVQVLND